MAIENHQILLISRIKDKLLGRATELINCRQTILTKFRPLLTRKRTKLLSIFKPHTCECFKNGTPENHSRNH